MEIVPKNCLYYRTNIAGRFVAIRNLNSTYRIEYYPSKLFACRGQKPMTIDNLRSYEAAKACDVIKNLLVAKFNETNEAK